MKSGQLWVVIPCYNEAIGIHWTIEALVSQTDHDFRLVFVDNASTDNTVSVIRTCCENLKLTYELISEPQKGTGAAADTGFRYAIKNGGQYIARTDADTSPAANWISQVKHGFATGLVFMAGPLHLRQDDLQPTRFDSIIVPVMLWVGVSYAKLFNRGSQYKYPFFMAAGNNMAITAHMYEKAGGFKRISIGEGNEDTMMAEVIRTMTTRAKYNRQMVVQTSVRRVRKYGYINTLRWYSDRHYRGEVDIR